MATMPRSSGFSVAAIACVPFVAAVIYVTWTAANVAWHALPALGIYGPNHEAKTTYLFGPMLMQLVGIAIAAFLFVKRERYGAKYKWFGLWPLFWLFWSAGLLGVVMQHASHALAHSGVSALGLSAVLKTAYIELGKMVVGHS